MRTRVSMRFLSIAVVLSCCAQGMPLWAATPYTLPKAARSFDTTLRSGQGEYTIQVGGTLDEFNTAAYPATPVGYTRLESKFQPNLYTSIENLGTQRLENIQLTINGRRDWSTVDSILQSVFTPGMSDADKALALFHHTADHFVQTHDNNTRVGPELPGPRDPWSNEFRELADPVKAANTYYSNGCSTVAANMAILAQHAGMDARVVWLSPADRYKTHAVAELYYDDAWHVFDPDSRAYFLDDDGRTVASYETLHQKPWLVEQTHQGGFASPGLKLDFAKEYARYWPPRQMPIDERWVSDLRLDLRPREKFVWRWQDDNKFRWGDNPRNVGAEPPQLANGKLIFTPDLEYSARVRDGAQESNVRQWRSSTTAGVLLMPARANELATLTYEVNSPFPIVGGVVGGTFRKYLPTDELRLSISTDGVNWQTVLNADVGPQTRHAAIDGLLPPDTADALYRYLFRVEMRGSSDSLPTLSGLYLETDVQMSELALPSLSVGENRVRVVSDSLGDQQIRLVHGWQESSVNAPPPAPDRLRLRGRSDALQLSWNQRPDNNREPIVDYQVQVSDMPSMQFPLGSNADRLTFSGATDWTLPSNLLRDGEEYFARVRGRDKWGAWSDWSELLSFRFDPFASRDGVRVVGDANLDGIVNTADLVHVFQRGRYEAKDGVSVTWSDGDWNGDLRFDSRDLVELFRSGEFLRSDALRARAVPEPTAGCLLTGLVLLTIWVRRR